MRARCAFVLLLAAAACGSAEAPGSRAANTSEAGKLAATPGSAGVVSMSQGADPGPVLLTPGAGRGGEGATGLVVQQPSANAATVLRGSCARASLRTQLVPSSLLFVIDRSGSMSCNPPPLTASPDCEREPRRASMDQPSKWEITKDALKGAIAKLPASTRVGVSYFSIDDSCGVSSTPSVPLAELGDGQIAELGASLDGTSPGGGTPLVGATILAYKHLHQRALEGRSTGNDFVVLLTDGQQSEPCGSTRCQGAQQCIDLLLNEEGPKSAGPGAEIRTFVIGAPGSEPARAMLSQLAVVGQTARPGCDPAASDCHFDMTKQSDFSAALSGALAAIGGETARCELPLPAPDDDAGQLDLTRLNVVLTPSSGAAQVIPQDERKACNAGANGWQFDAMRGSLRLCGDACKSVREQPAARLDVVLGCPVQGPS